MRETESTCGGTIIAARQNGATDSEMDLIRAAKQGDQSSYEQLFRDHVKSVLGTIFRMVHDQAAAEDLTQETFTLFFQYLPGFRGDCSPATRLYEIARQAVSRWARSKAAHPDYEGLPLTTPKTGPFLVRCPSHAHVDFKAKLDHFLPQLSQQQRAVFTYTWEGRSDEDIATIMDITTDTVRVHRFRAVNRLRGLINEASK